MKKFMFTFSLLALLVPFSQGCQASCCEEECKDKSDYECDYQWCVCRCENKREGGGYDNDAVVRCVKSQGFCPTYD